MFQKAINKIGVNIARVLVKQETQMRIEAISKEQADFYLKNARKATDKEQKSILNSFYKTNSQALDTYVYETFASKVADDNRGYSMKGKYYSHDAILQSFAQQNSISGVTDSKATDSSRRGGGSNLLKAASSYNNFAAPQLDDSLLTALGYETAVGNKILRRLAQMVLGKGFQFVGDNQDKVNRLNQKMRDMALFKTLISLLMQNFCYGGAFLIPVVSDWSPDDYASPFIADKMFMRKNTLSGFNVVNKRFVTPVFWQTWDATQPKYYEAYKYIQYGNMIDPTRLIKLTAGDLPEFLSASYLLNGVSWLQLYLKYVVFHNTAISSANNILIGNSIFILESSQIAANEGEKKQITDFQNNRSSPTGLLRINHGAKVYVASISLAHYDDMLTKSLSLFPTFMGDSVNVFMGTSQNGSSMIAKEGSQDTKNMYNSIEFLKNMIGYDHLKSEINNLFQLDDDGNIDHTITLEDIPVDDDIYRDELEVATLEMEYKVEWAELMMSLGVKRESVIEIVTKSIQQSQVSPLATELQNTDLEIMSDSDFEKMNLKKTDNANGAAKPGQEAKKVLDKTKKNN